LSRPDQKDVTTLLLEWRNGNQEALDQLIPLVYNELRQLAARQLRRERPGHTLQSTALVHEAYLQLIDQTRAHFHDREHFFAVAAQIIRRILVSHARKRNSSKRGAGKTLLTLDGSISLRGRRDMDLVAVNDAVESLSRLDPQQGRIVELRFFGGLTIEGTAKFLGVSTSTVSRDWNVARAWLYRELSRNGAYGP
jgi:RNA polymerase sigma factor (TIGR02999 family)